ncbi:beta-ketoacyl-[acyl-carrier-protein] synthase family protein [Alkalihalobacillus pseudalcaliphilus]|uniref:beta-ketoacyl-[acyl-carrier-protein] synthase family protein n=1 Tax=Alkalihalobacillus pseudalcaliphilus TaxID=79884 RepID=UPI00064DBF74|nr:beta-ketoacyl-[acyl-carrier-protein] synthase family protein [Alkalihalobacillus pseudalcaliphilus]KMK76755.1 3-oxoacyl-ACP synthase [Alkalihalobacillus pseudalcaliphilus]
MSRRVVITGLGVISSIGEKLEEFWDNCQKGVSGISNIKGNNITLLTSRNGGQVQSFNPEKYVKTNDAFKIGRGSQLLIAAMRRSIEDSDINYEIYKDAALVVGTTMGEVSSQETHLLSKENKHPSDDLREQNNLQTILSNATSEFKLEGKASLIGNACASGNYALINAFESIRNGKTNVAFAAGVDPFSTVAYYGFHRLNAIAPQVCSPFDKNRRGMMVAEGAGCLLLEDYEHAMRRNAKIYAEVAGYGVSTDAHHITAPHPEGEGLISCMNMAIHSANIKPEDVSYISAHGTGTAANDKAEGKAINEVFGSRTPVSSIKSMLGHSMGAASAIESIVCCLAIRDQVAPPTINFNELDPELSIDCIENTKREFPINIALNNSSAFGGMNASVVFQKIN